MTKLRPSVFNFKTGTEYLSEYYADIHTSNPRYSLRSFAQKIGVDQSTLTRYFAKDRFLSSDKAEVIAKNLDLTAQETHFFKLLTTLGDRGDTELLEKLKSTFLFEIYGKNLHTEAGLPYHLNKDVTLDIQSYLFLEMQCLKESFSFTDVIHIMNKHWGLDEKQTLAVINQLVAKGFIDSESKQRKAEILKQIFFVTKEVPREDGLRYHSDALGLFQKGLNDFDNSDIEIYTSVVSIKKEGREPILQAIKNLHALLGQYHAETEGDDVFLVSGAMMNLTKTLTAPTKS